MFYVSIGTRFIMKQQSPRIDAFQPVPSNQIDLLDHLAIPRRSSGRGK